MAISIQQYKPDNEKLVREFNQRLKAGGETFQFPESSVPTWLPQVDGRQIFQEYFLAIDDEQTVRGGYILKHQQFVVNGETTTIGNYQLPLSEGTIDKQYNTLGLRLLNDALRRNPSLYALGMGGMNRPLPRLLKAMGWQLAPVPFHFRILHPFKFLRNIRYLRASSLRRLVFDLLAYSGIGWLAIKLVVTSKSKGVPAQENLKVEEFNEFGDWTDKLWHEVSKNFRLAAVCDVDTLNILYPPHDRKFLRYRMLKDGSVIGWFVLLDTAMTDHKQFGNMRVGTIVDCLCHPGEENHMMRAASSVLSTRGVDMIVTNESYGRYGTALSSTGFLNGPSNFILAVSPELVKKVGALDNVVSEFHFNRGDGDGPIHL